MNEVGKVEARIEESRYETDGNNPNCLQQPDKGWIGGIDASICYLDVLTIPPPSSPELSFIKGGLPIVPSLFVSIKS